MPTMHLKRTIDNKLNTWNFEHCSKEPPPPLRAIWATFFTFSHQINLDRGTGGQCLKECAFCIRWLPLWWPQHHQDPKPCLVWWLGSRDRGECHRLGQATHSQASETHFDMLSHLFFGILQKSDLLKSGLPFQGIHSFGLGLRGGWFVHFFREDFSKFNFYQTRVRSLSMLVSDSLTDSLTPV